MENKCGTVHQQCFIAVFLVHARTNCHHDRSSHRKCSLKNAVLKNFVIFTEKHLRWSLFLITLQAFRPATLLKWDTITGVFLWILRNCWKNTYFEEHLLTTASDIKCLATETWEKCGHWSFFTVKFLANTVSNKCSKMKHVAQNTLYEENIFLYLRH